MLLPKKKTNIYPECDLILEPERKKEFILRCLSSFMVDIDQFIIMYQNKKTENLTHNFEILLSQKKSIEAQLEAKNQEIENLKSILKQTSITCPICLNIPESGPHTRFGCGHWMCQTCRKSFDSHKCHICNGSITSETNLYL